LEKGFVEGLKNIAKGNPLTCRKKKDELGKRLRTPTAGDRDAGANKQGEKKGDTAHTKKRILRKTSFGVLTILKETRKKGEEYSKKEI